MGIMASSRRASGSQRVSAPENAEQFAEEITTFQNQQKTG